MATLIVRSSDVSSKGEKVLMNLPHFQAGDGGSRILKDQTVQRPPEPGRGRSRKGKNGQKKQPQRGLGVAQLEKLRLQEQSKQEAAIALHYSGGHHSHSFSSANVNGLVGCFFTEQTGISMPHLLANPSKTAAAFQFLNRQHNAGSIHSPSPSEKINPHSPSISSEYDHSTPFIWAPKPRPDSDAIAQARSVADLYSKQKNGYGFCLPDSKNILSGAAIDRGGPYARFPCQKSDETVRLKGLEGLLNPALQNELKQVFDPAIHLPVAGVELFDSSPGRRLKRDCMELSLMNIPAIGDRPKELSSFQNYTDNQLWSSVDKASARKRPWLALQENPALLRQQSIAVDLNNMTKDSTIQSSDKGAHYTTGSVRCALKSSKTSPGGSISSCPDMPKSEMIQFYDETSCVKGSIESNPNDSSHSSASSFVPKKLKSTIASSGDFLSLRLCTNSEGEFNDSSEEFSPREVRKGGSSNHNSVSLQETVTDVEECSQISLGYGNPAYPQPFLPSSKPVEDHHSHSSPDQPFLPQIKSTSPALDLNLKLGL